MKQKAINRVTRELHTLRPNMPENMCKAILKQCVLNSIFDVHSFLFNFINYCILRIKGLCFRCLCSNIEHVFILYMNVKTKCLYHVH